MWEDYLEGWYERDEKATEKLYERYKHDWITSHVSPDEMRDTELAYEEYKKEYIEEFGEDENLLDFDGYIFEYGYANGMVYVCYEEFLDNELEDYALADTIERYLYERGEYDSGDLKWLAYQTDAEGKATDRPDRAETAARLLGANPMDLKKFFETELKLYENGTLSGEEYDTLEQMARMLTGEIRDRCPQKDKDIER